MPDFAAGEESLAKLYSNTASLGWRGWRRKMAAPLVKNMMVLKITYLKIENRAVHEITTR